MVNCLVLVILWEVEMKPIHGEASKATRTREYVTWQSMLGRCENSNDPSFARYGKRGVKVCLRWRNSYADFKLDMGKRPLNMTIERINSNGNYEPGNCRWASSKEQNRNRHTNKMVTWKGQRMSLAEACERAHRPYKTVWMRLRVGWTLNAALDKSVRKYVCHA